MAESVLCEENVRDNWFFGEKNRNNWAETTFNNIVEN
jgi:hypothetical protein